LRLKETKKKLKIGQSFLKFTICRKDIKCIIKALLRLSHTRREYYFSNLLFSKGIKVLKAKSFKERIFWLNLSYIGCVAYDYKDNFIVLSDFIKTQDSSVIRKLMFEVMDLACAIHSLRIKHNDFSLTNIIIENNKILLIDYENMSKCLTTFAASKEIIRILHDIYKFKQSYKENFQEVRLGEIFVYYLKKMDFNRRKKDKLIRLTLNYFYRRYKRDILLHEFENLSSLTFLPS